MALPITIQIGTAIAQKARLCVNAFRAGSLSTAAWARSPAIVCNPDPLTGQTLSPNG
jgi:hypothetical protein